jgi:transcriptional regulator with XRE-family HTH domain
MKAIERLKEAAKKRGTILAVARRAGLNHVTVGKIVTGKTRNPGVHTVAAIERALDELEGLNAAVKELADV